MSPLKAVDTTWSSVWPRIPFMAPSEAAFTAFLMSSYLAGFSRRTVRSTTDTLGVGTRNAMPVSLPLSSGMTLPTALAAPVDAGMMFWLAPRPSLHSLPEGPSTVFWVAVMACTVLIRPSTMPKLSLMTLARGAKQLVVQEALLTTGRELSYFSWFTPMTNMGASALGAEMITLLAPPSPHLMLAGSLSWKTVILCPSMTSLSPSTL